MKTLYLRAPAALASILIAAGCQFGPGPEGGNRERKHASVTRLKSSVLKPMAKVAASSPEELCGGAGGQPCLTPLNLEGRIYQGNLMVGGNGGPPGVPVRIIEGYDSSYHGPNTGRGGNQLFNLGKSTDLDGAYGCCQDNYPPDDLAKVHRLEFSFDYLDCTFQVPSTAGAAIAGKTYTVRLVYVDTGYIDDGLLGKTQVLQGDKLLKRAGESAFRFCTGSGCIAASRPEEPLRAAWEGAAANRAYPHYASVGITLKTPMSFTRAEAEAGGWRFTVDWDLGGAAVFGTADWAMLRTEAELVQAFDLLGGHGGPGNIGVRVDMTKAALAPESSDSTRVAGP